MADVRTATVTLLFTDIEGSTRLLRQLGRRYGEVLAEHERLLRHAFVAHGGEEIDTQGDSFFVAFESAGDAVAAAVDAQRGLAEHPWPDGVELRVRMGMHTGRASVHEKRYLGVAVHRAARICAAGHGGQVLLSETVRHLVEDEEDELPGIEFTDLGEQRLKDFERPVRLYQVVAEGLEGAFPPLRTSERIPERGTTPLAAAETAEAVRVGQRRRAPPRIAAIAAVAGVLVLVPIVALILATVRGDGGGTSLAAVAPNSVAVIDPARNKVVAAVPVGAGPSRIAVAASGVWVLNSVDRTVSRVDPGGSSVTRTIAVSGNNPALAANRDAAWVAAEFARPGHLTVTLSRIDAKFYDLTRVATANIPGLPVSRQYDQPAVATQSSSVWFALRTRFVRFDPTHSRTAASVDFDFPVDTIALGVAASGLPSETR